MINANVSIQCLPGVVGKENVFPIVDKVIEYIASTGVNYVVGPLETTMEGDLDELIEIVKRAQKICIEQGAPSVMSFVKISYAEEGASTIEEKIYKYR